MSKYISISVLTLLCTITMLARQESASDSKTTESPQRAEIRVLKSLLPTLPDRAPALSQLAHDYASLGDFSKAISLLKQCIRLREGFDPEGDPSFKKFEHMAEFNSLIEQVHREFPAVHNAKLAFTISLSDLIPEGLAVDPKTHTFLMSSMSHKKIVRVSSNGATSDFVPEGRYDLESVCGIKVDSSDESVWANTCPESGKHSELVHLDKEGKLLGRFSQLSAGSHMFNDLVLRNSEDIYLTDSLANQALRFDRSTHAFRTLIFARSLYYPNGIALSGDGNLLYVADAFGVLQYDLRNGHSREVLAGASRTISGFDGMYWYRNSLLGIQNSLGMPRVARFQLSSDGSRVLSAQVLEYRTDSVELPTTGAIDGSTFYFMTNTNIDNWKDNKIIDPRKLAPIRVAMVKLD